MERTIIEHCNQVLLEEHREQLVREIATGNWRGYFKVADWEPGTGKTLAAHEGIVKAVEAGRNVLFVRQQNKDTVFSAEAINQLAGREIALAFNNHDIPCIGTRNAIMGTLASYPVVVITHKRYQTMSWDLRQRAIFTEGRSVMIVDEFPDMMKAISVDMGQIQAFRSLLASTPSILELLNRVVHPIEYRLLALAAERDVKPVLLGEDSPDELVARLIQLVKSNYTTHELRRISSLSSSSKVTEIFPDCTVQSTCEELQRLCQFYHQTCVYGNGVLHGTDRRSNFWLLDDGANLLLDASSDFRVAYQVNPKLFRPMHVEKVLEYSGWHIQYVPLNTCKSGQNRVDNFYECVEAIAETCGPETLVVGAKDDMERLKSIPTERKAYHYNLVGSNEWRDMQNVVICQTPTLSDVNYALEMFYYVGDTEKLPDLTAKQRKQRTGTFCREFCNPLMERIRVFHIADHIYQAIKRVNRTMERETTVALVLNEEKVLELLKEKMPGCTVETVLPDEIGFSKSKQSVYDEQRQNGSYATQFLRFAAEVLEGKHLDMQYQPRRGASVPGKYKKKAIQDHLGIDNPSNFKRQVLDKDRVISFCQWHGIRVERNYILFPASTTKQTA